MEAIFFGGSVRRRVGVWVAVALFLAFAWPTLYWYAPVKGQLWRVNRITDGVTILSLSSQSAYAWEAVRWMLVIGGAVFFGFSLPLGVLVALRRTVAQVAKDVDKK